MRSRTNAGNILDQDPVDQWRVPMQARQHNLFLRLAKPKDDTALLLIDCVDPHDKVDEERGQRNETD